MEVNRFSTQDYRESIAYFWVYRVSVEKTVGSRLRDLKPETRPQVIQSFELNIAQKLGER
jgi:hypothetical protein